MKKITIIIGLLSLFIYIQPTSAYSGEPYNWGAGSDDVVIWGKSRVYNSYNNNDDGGWWWFEDFLQNQHNEMESFCWDCETGNGNNGNGDKVMARKNSLPPDAQAVLEQKMREMLAYCAYQEMYDHLLAAGAMFNDIAIDPSIPGGGYNPCQDKLLFGNEGYINGSFPEEFIHFFQDHYYAGGICQYAGSAQHYNIEFEAKVIQDLINHHDYIESGGVYLGSGEALGVIYYNWINHLTNGGTSMPTSAQIYQSYQGYNYWNFMNDWASWNGLQVDPNFGPNMFSILDGCW